MQKRASSVMCLCDVFKLSASIAGFAGRTELVRTTANADLKETQNNTFSCQQSPFPVWQHESTEVWQITCSSIRKASFPKHRAPFTVGLFSNTLSNCKSAGGHLNVTLYPHNMDRRAPLMTKLLKLGRIVLEIQTQTLKSTSHQSHANAHYCQQKTVRQHNKSYGGRNILAVELMTATLSKNKKHLQPDQLANITFPQDAKDAQTSLKNYMHSCETSGLCTWCVALLLLNWW